MEEALLARLRASWEALNNQWNQWVLNYTQGRQLDLLRSLGFSAPSWQDLAVVLAAVVAVVGLIGAAWAYWERQRHDPWLRLLHRARQRLLAAGIVANDSTPPRALAQRLQAQSTSDPRAAALIDWLMRLEALRYAPQTPGSLRSLQREFRQLDWPSRPRS